MVALIILKPHPIINLGITLCTFYEVCWLKHGKSVFFYDLYTIS